MLSVVVPVYNQIKMTQDFFNCISKNSVKPYEIILIDNSNIDDYSCFQILYPDLNIKYIKNEKNIGVNKSWNMGIELSSGKYISILNNDILITLSFFRKIIESFEDKRVGIVVPLTINGKYFSVLEDSNEKPKLEKISRREGWAFTIRKDITNSIPPIPEILVKCFGDDYLFYMTEKLGYKIFKDMNNHIMHYGSITQIKEFKKGELPKINEEREYWNNIKNKIDNSDLKNLGDFI